MVQQIKDNKLSIPIIITIIGMVFSAGIAWSTSQSKNSSQDEKITLLSEEVKQLKSYNIELMNYKIEEINGKVNALLEYFKIPVPHKK